jgi:UDP-N-acetylglucosamine diphosphorylase / glucose-1-phosphate thymidylyltransferase / UDP-N-acetylgalactosamine diphosphorylase / glucosamine-1-phosphate N-acetyltransferase / galactosamine-1-phosphate N-acetyltransferase
MNLFAPDELFELGSYQHGELFAGCASAWEALAGLHEYLISVLRPGIRGEVEDGAHIDGDVEIADGARVEAGAYIRGPALIGPGTEVRHGAYVRGNVITGTGCVIGHASECKTAIFLDHAKAPHFAYVGDSILGGEVNLGAGTRLANFKIVPGTVAVRDLDGTSVDTGLRKLGAVLGDGVQIGCNAVTSPGTVIGRESIVYPGASLAGTIPPGSVVTWKPDLVIRARRQRAG